MVNHDDVRPYRKMRGQSKTYTKRERERQKGKGWEPSGAKKRRKGPK